MKKISVHILNVGSGDSILFEFPNGEFGIIDLFKTVNLNQAIPPALEYLETIYKSDPIILAFVCISHFDYDHINGFNYLWELKRQNIIIIKQIWVSGSHTKDYFGKLFCQNFEKSTLTKKETELYKIHEKILINQKKELIDLEEKFTIWEKESDKKILYIKDIKDVDNAIINGLRVFSFGPLSTHVKEFEKQKFEYFINYFLPEEVKQRNVDNNLVSSILFFQYYNFNLVFGGDSPKAVWLDAIKENEQRKLGYNLSADLIKVSHHGSNTSSNKVIWDNLTNGKKSIYFAISAGCKFGHPHTETIEEIKESCKNKIFRIFSTNECQACVIKKNGEENTKEIFLVEKEYKYRNLFEFDRSPNYKNMEDKSKLGLWSYKFDINPNNKVVNALTLISKNSIPNIDCFIFKQANSINKECII